MRRAFSQDLRYAMRRLAHNPGFAALIILTLGLGIGANSAIFSVVDATLLRPLPFANPNQLLQLWETESAVVFALTMVVCLAACCVPARRAARVDPMVALRYE